MKHALATAIDQHELRLHMQPIIDLCTGQITDYEALIRWQHPTRGLLGPDNFIGLTEERQLIFKLGYWVIDDAITTLRALCDAGLPIYLDDFGTGYSSLALLKRLPVKKLKIDRSFIQDLDMENRKIVQAMTGLAHTLDMKVVAEGIEETGQLHILNSMHCDFGQGYLFSKPKPMDVILEQRTHDTHKG